MQPLTALVGALASKISIVPPVTPRKPLGWGLLLISALGLPNFKESARGLSVRSWGSWGPRPRRRFRLTRVDLHRGLPPAPDCAHPRRWVRPTRVLPREDVYSILPALPFFAARALWPGRAWPAPSETPRKLLSVAKHACRSWRGRSPISRVRKINQLRGCPDAKLADCTQPPPSLPFCDGK